MVSCLVPIFSTLALFLIMAVDMADSHNHYCANLPPIEAYFYDFVNTCHIRGMLDKDGDILTSCANITIKEHHDEISGSATLQGIDASGNFQKTKFTWQQVDENFQLITNRMKNPVAQAKAIAQSDTNEIMASIVYVNTDGYIMFTCPFSEETQKPGELRDVIICTWAPYIQKVHIDKLFSEAERLGINIDDVIRVGKC